MHFIVEYTDYNRYIPICIPIIIGIQRMASVTKVAREANEFRRLA